MFEMKSNEMVAGEVREYREITVTSKRQITIPKSFFDRLAIEETLVAYLLDDGIFLKPARKDDSVYAEDVEEIIRDVVREGYSGEELVAELARRLNEYNKFIERRIQEFERDLKSDSVSEDTEDEFYGLDVFFTDTETEETS
jgi:bifunctional DNA-binding transcriptional regulator/antitoxin component of YhaV-PrlF toxin-antitoxin module